MADPVRVHGVLVTYRRPGQVSTTLDRLRNQSRPLDSLVVVDNGSDDAVAALVRRFADGGLRVSYVDPGDNLGPAGGFALGMGLLLDEADDSDWIFLFDDDDPPFYDDAIENALDFALKMTALDPDTAGVGISGGRFDQRRGRVVRVGDDEIQGPVRVDHITGGGMPGYRVAAVRRVGELRPELFFGFEELEYGIRLTRSGLSLYADGDQWRRRKEDKREQGLLPSEDISERRSSTTNVRIAENSWRRYYSLRNLVFILREIGADRAALEVAVGRGILKPLVNLPLAPRLAVASLRTGTRAVIDGWRGHLGRRVEPPIPEATGDTTGSKPVDTGEGA
jgi:rhamnopyranosyl-N-acetylglucosaminyl-diphospho-decaprenol beta-1,3/1,4-galactofuranosyltransferase